jgi:hypothetical protein
VIIHRGNAFSGHYHAYIHDLLEAGAWVPVEMLDNLIDIGSSETTEATVADPAAADKPLSKR